MIYSRLLRFVNWLLVVVASAAGLAIVLAIARQKPEAVHTALASGPPWLRIAVTLAASQLLAVLLIRLTKPNVRHLCLAYAVPPAWAAVLIGAVFVYFVDTTWVKLIGGYHARHWEWAVYGVTPLALTGLHGFFASLARKEKLDGQQQAAEIDDRAKPEFVADETLNDWLSTESPATYDRLGTRPIANRIAERLADGSHSIGLVGPFGSGKTTVVSWVEEQLRSNTASSESYTVHRFSAWEFDRSTTAIEKILDSTVATVRQRVDTLMVESLPDSYRETFSAAGSWVRSLQDLMLGRPDAVDQFTKLNDYLRLCKLTVILVIEDLDRVDSANYQLAELFGFLDRLRSLDRINFLLTGARSSSHQIDFQKLCDYVEYLPPLDPQSTNVLLVSFRASLKESVKDPLQSMPNARQNNPWDADFLSACWEALTLIDAATRLLNTPRAARHALNRTRLTWSQLKGEIDFDDLLALNVLCYGAPEAFGFLLENHDRLRQPYPQEGDLGSSVATVVKSKLQSAWQDAVKKGSWRPAAAEKLMYFLLPTAEAWLGDTQPGSSRTEYPQAITEDRYWRRVLAEAVDSGEIRDQEVVEVSREWLTTNGVDNRLISRISDSRDFADVWMNLCQPLYYCQTAEARRLIGELVRIALERDGSEAGIGSANLWHGFRGLFSPLCRDDSDVWFKKLLLDISKHSLNLACEVWHHFGEPSEYSILPPQKAHQVWFDVVDSLRRLDPTEVRLATILPKERPFALHRLFEQCLRADDGNPNGEPWAWLVEPILEGLEAHSVTVALNTVHLFLRSEGGNKRIDTDLLREIFGARSDDLVEGLEAMRSELPDDYRDAIQLLIDATAPL